MHKHIPEAGKIELILREATNSDLPVLRELEQRVIEAERPFDASIRNDETHYYDLCDLISNQDSCLVVAEESNEIVGTGYAQIRASKEAFTHERHTYLGFMYVATEHRGKGINSQVMSYLVQWSKSKGITDLYLNVYHQNESAIKAYEKSDFEPCLLEMKLCF